MLACGPQVKSSFFVVHLLLVAVVVHTVTDTLGCSVCYNFMRRCASLLSAIMLFALYITVDAFAGCCSALSCGLSQVARSGCCLCCHA